ncbi:putative folate/biopterin transporter [Leptomonas pyrrhocoris]|uniref:Putative folate/biopterin transporter n=1 Tax=Leptomonas pyrrhocoris TaxID=157538 RepID=A0A0N0VDL9_LEPPY|nr:putative folate/biopterin transporter [Leptomonas pyrrhocoris]KPA75928.1 putative folate/biopterin transporter [Leptomonas pyrrhocoris]|eukprot:XP_015654367.1 putative folate/biopterin transporter [Leptomonas pyrrhocoris]
MFSPDRSSHNGEERESGTNYAEPAVGDPLDAAPPPPHRTEDGSTILPNGTIVHPAAERLFAGCPWVRNIPVVGGAVEGYGPAFVLALCMAYFLCKGIADQIIGFSRQPMMTKRFGIDGDRYQRLASLYSMGWAIKAFIAMMTDTFAFLGYTKRWYMVISCIGGAAFALGYGLLPAKESSANIAAGFIFLTCLGKSNVDILSEGHYSRLIRRNPVPGPSLVSCLWVCILTGTLIASVIQGPLSDGGKTQIGVFVSAVLQFVTAIFFIFNMYGERPNVVERLQDLRYAKAALAKAQAEARQADGSTSDVGDELLEKPVKKDLHPENDGAIYDEVQLGDPSLVGLQDVYGVPNGDSNNSEKGGTSPNMVVAAMDEIDEEEQLAIRTCLFGAFEINKEVVSRNWKVVVYCVIMTVSVVTMVCVTILGTTYDLMYACIVLSVVCIVCAFLTLPRVIAKANVFTYMYFTLYIQLPGALDAFYVADEECLPGGPHFTYTFYNTVGAVIQNIGGMIGVTLFTYVFSKQNYQVTMCVSVSLMIIASVFDIVIVERWNLYIGIPDHAMYICGDAVVYQVCYMFSYMPVVLLMSRLCPRGSESMVYALMAGFANLGQTMSNAIGSLLVEFRFPFKSKVPCDFHNVRWLIIIGHLLMPLAIVPLSFLLLPRVRICDDIDVNGHAIHAQLRSEKKRAEEEAAAEAERQQNAGNDGAALYDELGTVNEPCVETAGK